MTDFKPPKGSVWTPTELTPGETLAIKALARGDATPAQQRVAWDAIRLKLARCEDEAFFPDAMGGARATDYLLGMRRVASDMRLHAEAPMKLLHPNYEAKQ